jgi:ferric-dicitrate binding protein FerR (iron transport regulator)
MAKPTPPLGERQVTHVFRALAEEHLATRRKERDAAEQTWRRIQQRRSAELAGIRAVPGRETSWARRLLWLTVPPLMVAAGVAAALSWPREAPLDYQLLGGNSQGELITTDAKPAKLLFNDRSWIEAGTETTLNVHVIDGGKLVTRLSQGKLKVHVAHNPGTDWRFLAGPYEVQVVGTRFELSWEADRARLALVMHEGRVLVTAPGQKPRRVTAGEMLIIDDQQTTSRPLHPEPEAQTSGGAEDVPAGPPATAAAKPSGAVPGPTWAQQVAAGQFGDVVEDARKQGREVALAQRSSADLQALAQAARYTGDNELAVQTWSALRKRFAGQPVSSQAAFFLGRIYDQLGRSQDALKWFDTYLAEAPTGVYASETLGRKLTLVRSVRGEDKAHEVAREYLSRFPHGPYADTARDMLLNHD